MLAMIEHRSSIVMLFGRPYKAKKCYASMLAHTHAHTRTHTDIHTYTRLNNYVKGIER